MQQLTQEGQNIVNDLSNRYGLSADTVIYMIGAVNNGGGSMAQFNSSELGGSGQWMKGGMTMVGDMFNNGLKNTVNNLCSEISNALATTIIFPPASPGTSAGNQWWPTDLGIAFSSGGQNNTRYAIFPHRLAVEVNGQVTVYDTLDNNIGGISQQQGNGTSLTFNSQYGTINVSSLPIVSGGENISSAPQNNFAETQTNNFEQVSNEVSVSDMTQVVRDDSHNELANVIIELIEKLARLHDAGVLTNDEFNTKKSELLSRL